MKNDIGTLYSSTYSGRIKDLNPKFKNTIKPSTLSKDSNNFHKITTENDKISTSGEQPLLLYRKKEPKISHSFDYKMTKKNSDKNIYITDGGLKTKNEKFNSGYNYTNTNQNQNQRQIKSLRTYLESINVNKLLKTPALKNKKQAKTNNINSKKNIQTEEKVFYKTMRGSSNRPAFHKKFYNNEKNNNQTGEGFGLRKTIDIQNNNRYKKKPNNLNDFEESKKNEENKNQLIDSLIKASIKNNYIIMQKTDNKLTSKRIFSDRRKEYLKRNGIGISDVNLDDKDEENNKDNEKDEIKKMSKTANNFNHIQLNKYVKINNGLSPKQRNYYMTLNNETNFLNKDNISKNKKINKPIIDQFEYIKKINKHKRLCTHENFHKDNLLLKMQNDNKNEQLNDSFRHKNKIEINNLDKKYNTNNNEKIYLQKKKNDNPSSLIDVNDEWPYSHKKSYRSPKELNKFVKEKKLQNKQKANNEELQKNTKLFNKYKNLYNLNYQRVNNYNPNHTQQTKDKENEKEKTYSNKLSNSLKSTKMSTRTKLNSSGFKRRKEANEYYVGGDSFVNNNSTLIDPNEYYLNVLESQQLLVNSGLNKIENDSEEETSEITYNNDENNDNSNDNGNGINQGEIKELKEELNTSKEQIQKITKKESKRAKPNNLNNNININNIKNNINNLHLQKNNNIKINNKDNNKKIINNNKRGKEKIILNPKDVIKFVEVLKLVMQRKIFIILYQSYINQAIYQHYNIAFIYFIAICKHKAFRKIEEFCNYKAYSQVFRKLFMPFIKRSFRTFINNFYFKRKLEFLIILLTKFFKFKAMEKIFIYSQIMGEDEEGQHFEYVILKIMQTLFKPHMSNAFDKLKNYNKNNIKSNNEKIVDKNEDKKEDKKEEIKIETEKKAVPEFTRIVPIKNEEKKQKDEEDLKMEKKYKKIHKKYLEYSPTRNNKARSYLYESFSERSDGSYYRPNSLGNDKWHQLQTKLQLAKYMMMNEDYEEEEEIDDNIYYNKYKKFNYPQNNSFNSKKSEISSSISNEKKKDKKDKVENLKDNKIIKEFKEINDEPKKDTLNNNNNSDINKINIINDEGKNKDKNININNNINKDTNIEKNNNIKKDVDNKKNNDIKKDKDNDKNKKDDINNKKNNENNNIIINKEKNNQPNANINITIQKSNIINTDIDKNKNENNNKDKDKNKKQSKNNQNNNIINNEINIKNDNTKKKDIKEDNKKDKPIKKEPIKNEEDQKIIPTDKNKDKITESKIEPSVNDNKNIEDKKIVSNDNDYDKIKENKKKVSIVNNNKITEVKQRGDKKAQPLKNEKLIEPPEEKLKNKTKSEIDISADRDDGNSIDWEYSLNDSKNKIKNTLSSGNSGIDEPIHDKLVINYNIDLIEDNLPHKKIEKKDIILNEDKQINQKKDKKNNLIDSEEEDEKEEDDKKGTTITKNSKTLKKDKKSLNGSEDEYLNEFEDLDIDINSESEENSEIKNTKKIKLQKEKDIDKEKDVEKKTDNNKDKNEKSRNINIESNIKDVKINDKNDNQIIEQEIISSTSKKKEKAFKNIKDKNKYANDLTEEIIKKILTSEITSNKVKLIPRKSFKYEFFTNLNSSQSNLSASGGSSGNNLNRELGLLGLNQFSLNDDLSSLNDSIMSSYSAFSVFNRTIKDKKKEHSLNLYYKKIAPRLIKLIKEEIYLKYPRIYENISMPLKNQSIGLMMSLSLQDADMLRDNYKCNLMKESIKNIIDKEKILKTFEPINKQIRSKDNLTSDNFYDNILNECLVDTAIELINRERLYGENGDPLAWSSRTHELVFKYKKNDPKKLAKYVCSNLLKTLHTRIGLITENYDYLNAEQINNERDKRLIGNIRNELDEDEYQWRNLEMEETQLKVEIAELIMDQLYNENIEILEHIQFSRNRPDLYQNKSIYACEEIPKLSFQQTTTENANKDKDDGDEVINV